MAAPETLWQFASRVYASEPVRQACLGLQDQHDASVNLLLWAAWTALVHGHALPPDLVIAARQATLDWQREVLAPLRGVRRRLKEGHRELYERAKALELQFERIEIERLEAMTVLDGGGGADALGVNLALAAPPGAPVADLTALAHALRAAAAGC